MNYYDYEFPTPDYTQHDPYRQIPGYGPPVQYPVPSVPPGPPPGQGNINARLDRLERQVARLDRRLDRIERRLGIV